MVQAARVVTVIGPPWRLLTVTAKAVCAGRGDRLSDEAATFDFTATGLLPQRIARDRQPVGRAGGAPTYDGNDCDQYSQATLHNERDCNRRAADSRSLHMSSAVQRAEDPPPQQQGLTLRARLGPLSRDVEQLEEGRPRPASQLHVGQFADDLYTVITVGPPSRPDPG